MPHPFGPAKRLHDAGMMPPRRKVAPPIPEPEDAPEPAVTESVPAEDKPKSTRRKSAPKTDE